MSIANTWLAAAGGAAILVTGLMVSTPADAKRYRLSTGDVAASQDQTHDRPRRKRSKVIIDTRRNGNYAMPPWANFGVGPNSYSCVGYDCNW